MAGHSLGGLETLLFADRHPDRVVGMVMVDPSTPDQDDALTKAAPALMAWSGKRMRRRSKACGDAASATCRAGPRRLRPGAALVRRIPSP